MKQSNLRFHLELSKKEFQQLLEVRKVMAALPLVSSQKLLKLSRIYTASIAQNSNQCSVEMFPCKAAF